MRKVQVEGSTIPEAVAIEGVVLEAKVTEREAPSPEALVAPRDYRGDTCGCSPGV
jgi:hypothetical protein